MNEWLPGRNYSCPGTPSLTRRSFRSQRDDSEKNAKLRAVSTRGVSENKHVSCTQHSMEEISNVVLPGVNRKGGGTIASDPRFKRVIPPGTQNNVNGISETKTQKSPCPDENETLQSKFPVWSNTDFKSNKSWVGCLKDSDLSKFKQRENPKQTSQDSEYCAAATSPALPSAPAPVQTPENSHFDQTKEPLKAVDKLSFNHEAAVNSFSKESLSEWTANSRNTSLVSEDRNEDFSNALGRIPSSTRTKKVQNWIREQRPKPERKHSVITVIGQMQETDTLSSALQEIDKRRKLVKELDKFAVCKKLIETEKDKEISQKIGTLNNDEGVLLSASNETLNTSAPSVKYCEGRTNKNDNTSSNEKIRVVLSGFQYQKIFYILIFMCGILCWFAFFSIENGHYVSFDLFNSRPKPITWYERICNWLWEFFRPSDNYHRSTAWRSY